MDCRHAPASERQLQRFEAEFGPIPLEFRWFLANCGGGVCGSERIDGIAELPETHHKFRTESQPGGWTMRDAFIIGWDACGNPFGIERETGRVLVEDHNFGGVQSISESFQNFLVHSLRVQV